MIISRSPLRITLGGGGTDLPSYYTKYGGFLIAGAINKYVYTSVSKPFFNGFHLKYNRNEKALTIDKIKHPIIREVLNFCKFSENSLEISSFADIPAGTGLGSSGSFTTALIKSIFAYNKQQITQDRLAEYAALIEIDILQEPIGKQDQYIAAYGGLTTFRFQPCGAVTAEPLQISKETILKLENNLLLFFTGKTRSASNVLREQKIKSEINNEDMINNLHYIKEQAINSKNALENGDLREFAKIMNEHWKKKRERSKNISSNKLNTLYEIGINGGALGGKIVGAGGGGFLMFYAEEKDFLRSEMKKAGLQELNFGFDYQGAKLIYG